MLQLVNGLSGVKSLTVDFPKKLGEYDGKPFLSKGKRLRLTNPKDRSKFNRKLIYGLCLLRRVLQS